MNSALFAETALPVQQSRGAYARPADGEQTRRNQIGIAARPQRHEFLRAHFCKTKPLARRVVPKKPCGGDEDKKLLLLFDKIMLRTAHPLRLSLPLSCAHIARARSFPHFTDCSSNSHSTAHRCLLCLSLRIFSYCETEYKREYIRIGKQRRSLGKH